MSGPRRIIQEMLVNALRHHQAGRLAEAESIYQRILQIDIRHADSMHLLGMIAYQNGQHEAAARMIRKAIATDGRQAFYHSNLGNVLNDQGKLEEARTCYERALALNPDLAEVCSNLGNILHAQGRLDEAAANHLRALSLKPGLHEAHYNLGNVRHDQDQYEEAVSCYERALALKPDYAQAHFNWGCTLYTQLKLDDALFHYGEAVRLRPDYARARFRASLAQLLQGDFASGWHNYEWRWQSEDHETPMRAYAQPLWSGQKLQSGRLLIWGEQGIGDEVMFAGLIPEVIGSDNRCLLECDPRLKPLLGRSFPGVEVISNRDPKDSSGPSFAAHLPSGSLPRLYRTSEASFAATRVSYLTPDASEKERLRARYADGRRVIGLAWYTNNRKTGRHRSIEISMLKPLLARKDIRWVSLQYGDHEALEAQAEAANAPLLIDRSVNQLLDVDLFAAQIAAMDMVITIDNSTAHLAGALGVPVRVFLPFTPDWRWLQEREDCPWYPTMRLFRQSRRGDWQTVIERMANSL